MLYINGKVLKREYFPAGEIKVPKELIEISDNSHYAIEFRYTDDLDLFHLYLVREAIEKHRPDARVYLNISYMPHARMDRENDTFVETLSIVKKFIKDLKFHTIAIHDPHSTVASCFQDQNINEYYYTEEMVDLVMEKIGFDKEIDLICFPDKGAHSKYQRVCDGLLDYKHVWFEKERDFATGKIIGHKLSPECKTVISPEAKVIIIDDICSYGTTFMNVAKELKKIGIKDIHLVVSHLEENIINNNALWKEDYLIKTITTTNSIFNISVFRNSDRIKILNKFPQVSQDVKEKVTEYNC